MFMFQCVVVGKTIIKTMKQWCWMHSDDDDDDDALWYKKLGVKFPMVDHNSQMNIFRSLILKAIWFMWVIFW